MATDIGTGATITFGTSGFTAEITNMDHGDMGREAIDTSHLGTTTARTFMPGDLYDPGSLTLDIHFDNANDPPLTGAAETITITFPDASTRSGSGFVTGYSYSVPLEDKMTAQMTVKFSGAFTF